jgi:SAM-dependent methyltransferase
MRLVSVPAKDGPRPQEPGQEATSAEPVLAETRKGTVMGTGKEQAELWGPGARDWSDYNEPMCTPFYEAVLDATEVGPATTLLDVGCGGGFAMLLAARRGATVSGIDTTPALLDIVRERVPDASLAIADLEDPLPFDAGEFDVVTAFNSVQYAADPVAALKNMSQVTKPGGLISVVVWGPPAQCESGVLFTELGPLMPPAPPSAPGAIAWSEDGQLEQLAATAGLAPLAVRDVPNPLIYPDLATAVRTQLSSGPARSAIQHSGLPAVRGALTRAFAGSRQPDGSYRQENVFRYLVARA